MGSQHIRVIKLRKASFANQPTNQHVDLPASASQPTNHSEQINRSTNQPALVAAAASTQGALAQFLIADSLQRGEMQAGHWARAWARRRRAIRGQSRVVRQLQQRPSEASTEPWEPDGDFAFPPLLSPSSPCPPRPLQSKPMVSSTSTLKFGAL